MKNKMKTFLNMAIIVQLVAFFGANQVGGDYIANQIEAFPKFWIVLNILALLCNIPAKYFRYAGKHKMNVVNTFIEVEDLGEENVIEVLLRKQQTLLAEREEAYADYREVEVYSKIESYNLEQENQDLRDEIEGIREMYNFLLAKNFEEKFPIIEKLEAEFIAVVENFQDNKELDIMGFPEIVLGAAYMEKAKVYAVQKFGEKLEKAKNAQHFAQEMQKIVEQREKELFRVVSLELRMNIYAQDLIEYYEEYKRDQGTEQCSYTGKIM